MRPNVDKPTTQTPIDELRDIMVRLRDPDGGCPWDIAQSFATIAPYTIEEAYEVADAIQRDDLDGLVDELGDLLFQVVFYARMAEESGAFDFDDITRGISDKMLRRHPHVFGGPTVESQAVQNREWEAHKAAERAARAAAEDRPPSALDGVALALPALMRAHKLQRRAARVGFDWPDIAPVLDKVAEEIEEVRAELAPDGSAERRIDEIGDLLFACVNLARHAGVDAESALRGANDKFEGRFRGVETALAADGQSTETASLDEMERLWEREKLRSKTNNDI
jgi:ATP diphosphatase